MITENAEIQTPNTINTETQHSKIELPQDVASNVQKQETVDLGQPTTKQPTTTQTKPNNTITNTQPVAPTYKTNNVAVQIPSDFNDATVQGYLNEYNVGVADNDYQAQINALTAIDNYRTSNGFKPLYSTNIYELTNLREQKIKNEIANYEAQIADAYNRQDYQLAQQVGQQLEAYKRMVNYTAPTNPVINELENAEYVPIYESAMNDIVKELLTSRFTYDPADDEALQKAQEYATNTVYESMNTKGILDSTMTAQIITKTVNELIPVYENMSKEEFYNNIERLQSMANLIMQLDQTQYNRWSSSLELKLQKYEAQKDEIAYQWDRVDKLGYVDNEASIVLGVAPGVLSPAKREAIEEAERTAQEEYNRLQSDKALAQFKAELENDVTSGVTQTTVDKNGTTIYGSKTSDTDIKNIIKQKYESEELDEAGAIREIYANFTGDKAESMLSSILGKTAKEADEVLGKSLVSDLVQINGIPVNEESYPAYEAEIVRMLDAGEINDDIAYSAMSMLNSEKEYNYKYDTIMNALNTQINMANKKSKKELKKITFSRYSEIIENHRYDWETLHEPEKVDALLEDVKAKEEELRTILKNKGIDW